MSKSIDKDLFLILQTSIKIIDCLSRITKSKQINDKLEFTKGSFAQIVEEGLKNRNLNKDIKFDFGKYKRRSTSQEQDYFQDRRKEPNELL